MLFEPFGRRPSPVCQVSPKMKFGWLSSMVFSAKRYIVFLRDSTWLPSAISSSVEQNNMFIVFARTWSWFFIGLQPYVWKRELIPFFWWHFSMGSTTTKSLVPVLLIPPQLMFRYLGRPITWEFKWVIILFKIFGKMVILNFFHLIIENIFSLNKYLLINTFSGFNISILFLLFSCKYVYIVAFFFFEKNWMNK